ncbi:MAG: hypothetical protein WBL63_23190 [Candidatus Acidiferrum sp.]
MPAKPEFRFRLNGRYMPAMKVQRAPDGGCQIMVRDDSTGWSKDADDFRNDSLGWFLITADFTLEYRDETAWALVPIPMRQESVTKGWCRAANPQEFIEILFAAGVIR